MFFFFGSNLVTLQKGNHRSVLVSQFFDTIIKVNSCALNISILFKTIEWVTVGRSLFEETKIGTW